VNRRVKEAVAKGATLQAGGTFEGPRRAARLASANPLIVVGNELLVALYERSESLPVEPLLGDIADVFQVPVAQARHGKQFVSQRLVRIVEGGLMDLAALRHRPPSSSESFVRVVRRQQEAAPFVEDFQRVPFVVLNASRRNSLLNVCERNAP
jgi:hypothetical protein